MTQHYTGTMSSSKLNQLTIITGASRGMGLAMAQQRLTAGHRLLTLSRHPADTLETSANTHGATLTQWQADLAHALPIAERLGQWIGKLDPSTFASATLINNAGVVPTIAPLHQVPATEIADALRIGLEAAMLLTATFLAATSGWQAQRRVLNISSGLGRRPMASQATYCAAKAGMDLFTQSVALEQAAQPNGARLCALAPGVIDTDMQVQMRDARASAFPDQQRFVGLKQNQQLSSPQAAATQVLAYLDRPDFGQNPVADVRDNG